MPQEAGLTEAPAPSEASLLAADAEQRLIIVEQELAAQTAFLHDNYIINAPVNRVLREREMCSRLWLWTGMRPNVSSV